MKKNKLTIPIIIVTILAVMAVFNVTDKLFHAMHDEFHPYWYNKDEVILAVIIFAVLMIVDVFLIFKSDISFKPAKSILIADLIAICFLLFTDIVWDLYWYFKDIFDGLAIISVLRYIFHNIFSNISFFLFYGGSPFLLTSSILGTAIAFKQRKSISRPYAWILLGIIEIGCFVWLTYESGIFDF